MCSGVIFISRKSRRSLKRGSLQTRLVLVVGRCRCTSVWHYRGIPGPYPQTSTPLVPAQAGPTTTCQYYAADYLNRINVLTTECFILNRFASPTTEGFNADTLVVFG